MKNFVVLLCVIMELIIIGYVSATYGMKAGLLVIATELACAIRAALID